MIDSQTIGFWRLSTPSLLQLWPCGSKQGFDRHDSQNLPSCAAMNNTRVATLMLSLSSDSALQQVLTDSLGCMLVGETPDFLTADAVIAQSFRTEQSWLAPRILQSLQSIRQDLIILCSPDLLHLPWAAYVNDCHTALQVSDIHVKPFAGYSDQPNVRESLDVNELDARKPLRPDHATRINRHVFSLSYDLVDSTVLMAQLGAESYAFLLSRVHSKFAAIAERWQGQIDMPQGDDGCMCYFGAISADEHAGLACLQAALEMRNVALTNGWKIRIGIAAGWVAVDNNQPVGLSVHLAARLQKLATVGNIAVTQELAMYFAAVFEFIPMAGQTKLKGFDTVAQIAQLHDHSHELLAFPRPFRTSYESTFVGREAQLIQLKRAWARACNGHGSEHLIIGPSGIGKSTLIQHWIESNRIQSRVLTCGPHDYRNPFAPLAQWIAKEIGLELHGKGKVKIANLQACISRHPSLHAYRHELAYLLDTSALQSSDLFEDAEARHQQVIDAIVRWIASICVAQPVLIVVEDYQWIDASTALWVDRLQNMTCNGHALMLIVTQRPPLNNQAMYSTESTAIQVAPLTSRECRQVIAEFAPNLFKDEQLVRQLEINAQGIPLFLKESLRLLQSPEYQNKLQLAKRLGLGLPVPESLQNLLMERLDQLGPVRQVAQIGSFLGELFTWELLQAVHASMYVTKEFIHDLDAACELLVREKVWNETHESGQQQFAFTHAMIRDVAYQSMWASDRKVIHRLISQVLQEAPWSDGDTSVTELGRHLAAAGETSAAINLLLAAGKRNKKRGAHQVAKQTMQTALELLELAEPSETTLRGKIEAHLALAGQVLVTNGYAAISVEDHYSQALVLSKVLQDHKSMLRALMGMQSFHFMRGNFTESHRVMDLAKETASRVKHPLTQLQLDWALANLLFYEGKLVESCALMDECISRCTENGVGQDLIQNPQVMAMMYRAFSLCCLGRFTDSIAQARAGCAVADAGSHRLARLQAHGIAAMVYHGCGLWLETLHAADTAIASCQLGEYNLWLAHANVMRGVALARLGSYSEGLALLRANHSKWSLHGGTLTRSYYWALEAELLLAQQDGTGAQAVLEAAKEHLLLIPERYYISEIDRLAVCLKLRKSGDLQFDRGAYDKLLSIHSDAKERQLHGLALKVAISLFEQTKNTSLEGLTEEKSIAEQCLQQSLKNVQQDAVTKDVSLAQSYLVQMISHNVLHIHHYKRA